MFGFFPNAVGVANVFLCRDRLEAEPRLGHAESRRRRFFELVDILLVGDDRNAGPFAKRERQKRILAELRASNDLWIPGLVDRRSTISGTCMRRAWPSARAVAAAADLGRSRAGTAGRHGGNGRGWRRLAMRFVRPHMVVMIDGGPPPCDLARRMATDAQSITVITNNLPAATVLSDQPDHQRHLLPRPVLPWRPRRGRRAETMPFLSRFRANLAILGACGIDADGLSSAHADAASIKRAMLERAEEPMLVLDHTKFGRRHPIIRVCPLADIDHLLCDTRPAADLRTALAQRGASNVRWP